MSPLTARDRVSQHAGYMIYYSPIDTECNLPAIRTHFFFLGPTHDPGPRDTHTLCTFIKISMGGKSRSHTLILLPRRGPPQWMNLGYLASTRRRVVIRYVSDVFSYRQPRVVAPGPHTPTSKPDGLSHISLDDTLSNPKLPASAMLQLTANQVPGNRGAISIAVNTRRMDTLLLNTPLISYGNSICLPRVVTDSSTLDLAVQCSVFIGRSYRRGFHMLI